LPSVCPTALGKESTFAECHLGHSAKNPLERVSMSGPLPSAWYGTRQSVLLLPSARAITLGKEHIPVPRSWFFAECYGSDTRQSTSLPSVTLGKVTSRHLFCLFSLFHPNKQKIFHRYHIYTSQIITDIYSQHKQY
jgi:hypothetical protein